MAQREVAKEILYQGYSLGSKYRLANCDSVRFLAETIEGLFNILLYLGRLTARPDICKGDGVIGDFATWSVTS